jgi:hypothetical protein
MMMVRWRRRLFLWKLGFFGLSPNHSIDLHTQIFDMVYYGNGFTITELYQMPTRLRIFYYNRLVKAKKEEKTNADSVNKSTAPSKVRIKR